MPFSENQSLSLSFCWCPVNFSRKSYREESDSRRKVHASLTLRSPSFYFYLLTYLFLHRKLEERVKQDVHDPFSLLRPLTNKENVGWPNHGHEGDEKRRREDVTQRQSDRSLFLRPSLLLSESLLFVSPLWSWTTGRTRKPDFFIWSTLEMK